MSPGFRLFCLSGLSSPFTWSLEQSPLVFRPLLGTVTFWICPLPTVYRPGSVSHPRPQSACPHRMARLALVQRAWQGGHVSKARWPGRVREPSGPEGSHGSHHCCSRGRAAELRAGCFRSGRHLLVCSQLPESCRLSLLDYPPSLAGARVHSSWNPEHSALLGPSEQV